VNTTLKSKPLMRILYQPWIIWFSGALFYAYESVLQVSNGVMAHSLMHDFNITAAQLSRMSALYFFAYGIIQIPIGLILDRVGVKKPLILAVMLCIIGTAVFSQATHFHVAGLGRLLIGLGSSFAALSCLQLAALWFPASKFSLLTGLLLMIGMCGQLIGETPLAFLIHQYSWRVIVEHFTWTGIGILAVISVFVKDRTFKQLHSSRKTLRLTHQCSIVMRNPKSWCFACYAMLMYTPFLIFSSLWGVPFLMASTASSQLAAAQLLSWMLIGFAVGAPILGWCADHSKQKMKVLVYTTFSYLLTLCWILYYPTTHALINSAALFLSGFFCSGFLPSFSMMKELHPPTVRATSLGFMNTLNMLGTWIVLPIVGILLDYTWHDTSTYGARTYTLEHYQFALSLCPMMIVLALVFLFIIQKGISYESG